MIGTYPLLLKRNNKFIKSFISRLTGNFNKIKKMIIKEIDEERFRQLTYTNPLKVIRNETIDFFIFWLFFHSRNTTTNTTTRKNNETEK